MSDKCESVAPDGRMCTRQQGHVRDFSRKGRVHADKRSTGPNWWDALNEGRDERMTEADHQSWARR